MTTSDDWAAVAERRETGRRRAYLRSLGDDELMGHIDAAHREWAEIPDDGDDEDTRAFSAHIVAREIGEAEAELARRRRLHAAHGTANPDGASVAAWLSLAGDVRARADLPKLVVRMGHQLRYVGRNARAGGEEWCGPCPWCGGDDRFRVWTRPAGHYWCRKCDQKGDALAFFRAWYGSGRLGWREALRVAAAELGIPTPDDRPAPSTGVTYRRPT